ncbi:MAG: GWxTD domain-containing protein [Omnitrophica WOR_2 bacterium]|jgi:GWxTD domain-containing protein
MKKLAIIILFITGFAINIAQAQGIGAYLSHATFNIPGQSPYMEVYLEIIGNTLAYKQLPNGQFQGSINVTMIIKQDSVIKDFKKYDLLSAEVPDTSGVGVNFIDQQRFTLPNGEYNLELSIADNNVVKKPQVLTYPISVDYSQSDFSISTIQLVNSYIKSSEPNMLSKSGYDLVPLVDNFYSSAKNKLIFYTEIYNPNSSLNPDEKYLLSYYIESFENRKVLSDFARIKKETSKPVIVTLNEIDISKLPTGNYNLVVSLKDKTNKEIVSGYTFFQRSNPNMDSVANDYSKVDLTNSFVSKIMSVDTLREFVKSLSPIATDMEKIFIDYQASNASLSTLQQYFEKFWEARDAFSPKDAWETYKVQVRKVNEAYSTQVKRGYETDMGYVYLKYGAPSTIQDVPFEAGSLDGEASIPYQIWQYYSLFGGKERNKKFVFVNSELGAKDYTLVHSDVKGEIQNYGWRALTVRGIGSGDLDADKLKRDNSRAATRYNNPY